jgi:hypothetical protein
VSEGGRSNKPGGAQPPATTQQQEAQAPVVPRKPVGVSMRERMAPVDSEREAASNRIARSLKAWRAEKGRQQSGYRVDIPQEGGAGLPGDLKTKMEGQLGADLSGVKIHAGSASAKAADGLGARAFTVGQDVHFGGGEFQPGTKEGDRLIAHELTHTVQGARSGVQRKAEHDAGEHDAPGGHEVSQPGEPAEKEADAVADHAAEQLHGGEKEGAATAPKQQAPAIAAKLLDGVSVHLKRDKDKPTPPVDPATRKEIELIKQWIEKEASKTKVKWSAASVGVGTVLTKIGASAGTLAAPGIGTLIGGAAGAVAGALVSIFGIGSKKHHAMEEKAKLLDNVDLLVHQPEVIDDLYTYIRALEPDLKTIAAKIDAAVAELRNWEKKKADQDKRKQQRGVPPKQDDKLDKVGHAAHKGHSAAETTEAGAHVGAAGAEVGAHAVAGVSEGAARALEAAVPVLETAGHIASGAAVGVGAFVTAVDAKSFLDKRRRYEELKKKQDQGG